MSSELVSEYAVSHGKAKSFYECYERKEELQHQTHYCPGCGHGITHKLIAQAIDELPDRYPDRSQQIAHSPRAQDGQSD